MHCNVHFPLLFRYSAPKTSPSADRISKIFGAKSREEEIIKFQQLYCLKVEKFVKFIFRRLAPIGNPWKLRRPGRTHKSVFFCIFQDVISELKSFLVRTDPIVSQSGYLISLHFRFCRAEKLSRFQHARTHTEANTQSVVHTKRDTAKQLYRLQQHGGAAAVVFIAFVAVNQI